MYYMCMDLKKNEFLFNKLKFFFNVFDRFCFFLLYKKVINYI